MPRNAISRSLHTLCTLKSRLCRGQRDWSHYRAEIASFIELTETREARREEEISVIAFLNVFLLVLEVIPIRADQLVRRNSITPKASKPDSAKPSGIPVHVLQLYLQVTKHVMKFESIVLFWPQCQLLEQSSNRIEFRKTLKSIPVRLPLTSSIQSILFGF